MLFKQAQLFTLTTPFPKKESSILPKLEPMLFKECPPSFSSSFGWIATTKQENAPLVYSLDSCLLFQIQFEEKVLPSGVIRKELENKINELQTKESRKIYAKEKKDLRDEVTMTLLPRAFTQLSQVYACIDTKNNWVILNTLQTEKTKSILSLFKKCFDAEITPLKLKKIPYILTQWLKNNDVPENIDILDDCLLQDPNNTKRRIRGQSQDLFSTPIQSLIDSGLEAQELQLSWQNSLRFTITEQLHFKNFRYEDQVAEEADEAISESALDRFHTDFLMMTRTLEPLFSTMITVFADSC